MKPKPNNLMVLLPQGSKPTDILCRYCKNRRGGPFRWSTVAQCASSRNPYDRTGYQQGLQYCSNIKKYRLDECQPELTWIGKKRLRAGKRVVY